MRRILATTAALFFSCLILFYIHSLVFPSNPITSHSHAAHYELDRLTASHPLLPPNETTPWSYHPALHAHRLTLTESQCHSAFPHLFTEIDRAKAHRAHNIITPSELTTAWRGDGIVRAMIHSNQLYIIEARSVWDRNHRPRHLATLHALHRALVSSPEDLPDIEFTITDHDSPDFGVQPGEPGHTTWAYSRLPSQPNLWLIPDFGFWAWPDVNLRSYGEMRRRITTPSTTGAQDQEQEQAWADKKSELIWRGSVHVGSHDVRASLIEQSQDKPWSAVAAMDWGNKTDVAAKLIGMEDHCGYKFVAQTEGNTYSARLKYLLNCGSLVIAHEHKFVEHFTHLLRKGGEEQNYVQVRRDWKDLGRVMRWLLEEEGDRRAEEVARRSREVFRDRYLSPAAEACYWRELVRAWREVQGFEPKFWEEIEEGKGKEKKKVRRARGVPFESYAIMEATDWEMPTKPRKICEYD
ncbi:glycosyl transferase family 90-domain-containing protein [Elsinoe ampelina]|uniref:Glycosyl transferase family 90-domain-containing protein n=1 Tax=Elsinoe ampelina TaxID=302913 RepID=A0A6A6FZB5_9PEZI|nr:glycosyl transferase family 90-domain-containing protein [Elsinoe ampelina]